MILHIKYFTVAEMSRGPLSIQPQEKLRDLETSKQCYVYFFIAENV